MANAYKRAHGATIKFGSAATAIEDATIIGLPGDASDLIEKPSLTDTRKQYDLSDTPDSPEIAVTVPYGTSGVEPGDEIEDIVIALPKIAKTLTFDGIIVSVLPDTAEVGGLLAEVVTIKPTSAAVIGNIT